ncbi:DUF2851 family protein [Rufibacter roseus]|uniref:DUF2851 family protein n=1 Tax=Rufibacter roseus TaxID=1567108 RepID=A0ABW2DKJ8_9BACT|nr:DUF2851 family protein [Rufibacter roseus]
MKEDFLHYIWQYQYFHKEQLQTTAGEEVVVLHPGFYNKGDAGPDFSSARVLINNTEWAGSVEIHLKSSDWRRHQHQHDAKYNQVILHVVWEEDEPVRRQEGTLMPTLELKGLVNLPLQAQYQELFWSKEIIPCAPQAPKIDSVHKSSMMDKTLVERLELKAGLVLERLEQNKQDWEATVYQTMAYGFGFKINQDGFLRLTQVLPWNIINRYCNNPNQLEALLFGQAGFLHVAETAIADEYVQTLAKEHRFLAHKHNLSQPLPKSAWNMLRLRPANFPAVRLGQFFAVLQAHPHLWSELALCDSKENYYRYFLQTPPIYWQQHYAPGKPSAHQFPHIGEESIQNLLINVVAPLLVAYGKRMGNETYQDKAIELLESLGKEQNRITRLYSNLGFTHRSAADSQALIGLYHTYCTPRKCVHCAVGHRLMKQNLT